jgi:5-hydroxyisourate hydrolase
MGRLTTHVLDASHGCPGAGITLRLYRVEGTSLVALGEARTDADGRCAPLLEGEALCAGVYQLHFAVGDYYRARGVELPEPAFLDEVVLRFGVAEPQQHYHVPLLVSPYSYSTYRGS